MSGTIEIVNNNVITKFSLLRNMFSLLRKNEVVYDISLEEKVNSAFDEYILNYIIILVEYFQLSNGNVKKLSSDYYRKR